MKPRIQVSKKSERKTMNNKFDELAKGLAQSVTRRQMFGKLGGVIVGTFAVWLGLDRVSGASGKTKGVCAAQLDLACGGCYYYTGVCVDPTTCQVGYSSACQGKANNVSIACGGSFLGNKGCSF
jgi:hypothetical protein